MPICRKCSSYFPNRVKIEGKYKHIANRKYCLSCSPFGAHNTRKLEVKKMPDEKICACCGENKPQSEYYYRKDRDDLSVFCKKCFNKQVRKSQSERAEERRIKLIRLGGGECEICGYSKNSSALTFHHKNEEEKSFGLSLPSLRNKPWDVCLLEAKKCILVCANCHMELHYPNKNNWKAYKKKTKKQKSKPDNKCIDCNVSIGRYSQRCRECSTSIKKSSTKIQWPEIQLLVQMIKESSLSAVSKKLRVDRNTIKRRLKKYNDIK